MEIYLVIVRPHTCLKYLRMFPVLVVGVGFHLLTYFPFLFFNTMTRSFLSRQYNIHMSFFRNKVKVSVALAKIMSQNFCELSFIYRK